MDPGNAVQEGGTTNSSVQILWSMIADDLSVLEAASVWSLLYHAVLSAVVGVVLQMISYHVEDLKLLWRYAVVRATCWLLTAHAATVPSRTTNRQTLVEPSAPPLPSPPPPPPPPLPPARERAEGEMADHLRSNSANTTAAAVAVDRGNGCNAELPLLCAWRPGQAPVFDVAFPNPPLARRRIKSLDI